MMLEIILGIVLLHLLLTLWSLRIILLEVQKGVATLDSMLAATIQKFLEGGLGDIEPVNPIQQALAQMLTNRITLGPAQEGAIDVQPRAPDGKFSP